VAAVSIAVDSTGDLTVLPHNL